MDINKLARIDLQLLVALHVLLDECHVSRAAERMFVSQSAMSRTLARLRDMFDDPLFTRSGHGLTPSPRAEELRAPLREFLEYAEALIAPPIFNPANYSGEMKIAISEMIGTAILPPLVEQLQQQAPAMRLRAITRVEQPLEKLASGEIDAAIHARYSDYGQEFNVDLLATWPPIVVVRKDHPLTRLPTPLPDKCMAELQAYPRVILCLQDIEWFSSRWGGGIKKTLEGVHVQVETSNMMSALEIVKRTDCTFYSSPAVCHHPPLGEDLAAIQIPYSDQQLGEYVLATHERSNQSPAHQWLRARILETARNL